VYLRFYLRTAGFSVTFSEEFLSPFSDGNSAGAGCTGRMGGNRRWGGGTPPRRLREPPGAGPGDNGLSAGRGGPRWGLGNAWGASQRAGRSGRRIKAGSAGQADQGRPRWLG